MCHQGPQESFYFNGISNKLHSERQKSFFDWLRTSHPPPPCPTPFRRPSPFYHHLGRGPPYPLPPVSSLSLTAFSLIVSPDNITVKNYTITSVKLQAPAGKMFVLRSLLVCCVGQYNYSFHQCVIIVLLFTAVVDVVTILDSVLQCNQLQQRCFYAWYNFG